VFGHSVGDALLCEGHGAHEESGGRRVRGPARWRRIHRFLRTGPQPATAELLAERLQAAVADDIEIAGHQLRIGLSVGVAIFPTDGTDAAMLQGNADAALYRAKADGRGSVRFFEADMDRRLRERRALQRDLQSAVDRGELSIHYQPQSRLGDGVVGFEALVRWHHPSRGLIPPNTFIPLAEESGLIISIGEWILRETCREAASWPRPLQIAVNLSPVQFQHGDLPTIVHVVLLETGLAANRLESRDHRRGADRRLYPRTVDPAPPQGARRAHRHGRFRDRILLAVLSAIIPFDKIKIDQSFVSTLDRSPQSAAIIRAVIGLGRGLKLPVIAEGVETAEQLAFLTDEACDEVQGYLVGRPCPSQDYAELVGRPPVPARNPSVAT